MKTYNWERIGIWCLIAVIILFMGFQQAYLMSFKEEAGGSLRSVNSSLNELSSNLNVKINKVAEENQKSVGEVAGNLRGLQGDFNELKSSNEGKLGELEKQISDVQAVGGDFSGVIKDAMKGVVSVEASGSLGSGAIIDDRGYIVTNYHVIENGRSYKVLTYDGEVHNAVLIGYSSPYDVALLKINPGYDALDYGDSDDAVVGEKVIAIGNPLGLSFSVSEGIISGVNRGRPNLPGTYIQTDVSINPGNSGGPLIDAGGEVIGINNFKISGEMIEGLGFALNANDAKKVTGALIEKFEASLVAK